MVMEAQDTKIMPGYKLTEVGVIPEDWEIKKLGNTTDVIMGQSPIGVSYNQKGFGMPLINGPTEFTDKHPVKLQWTTEPTKFAKKGDLLLCVRGSSTGRINISDDTYCIGRGVAAIRAKTETDMVFITYVVLSAVHNILSLTSGSTFPNIDGKTIKTIQIPLPPLPEQRAIATALSDIDALITSLNKLIAKKRDIKQATMQQLLTGKTRLPGFRGEWEVKKLEEMLKVRHGKSQQGVVVKDGIYPILATSGEIGRTNNYLYNRPSVLIGRKGTIDAPQYMDTPFWTIDTLFYTEIFDQIYPKYVFYLFHMIDWLQYNEASGVPSLNASTIENIEVQCPYFSEQTAIATILSDMDAEIAALEQKREKTRMLKQGMMQELLTGKTRLL